MSEPIERKINVDPGEFPFPLSTGPDESRYLTWVRNHSNYMAERGFLDYLRIVAVLIRGIAINFLTILPGLLLAALCLALFFRPMLVEWQQRVEQGRGVFDGRTAAIDSAIDELDQKLADSGLTLDQQQTLERQRNRLFEERLERRNPSELFESRSRQIEADIEALEDKLSDAGLAPAEQERLRELEESLAEREKPSAFILSKWALENPSFIKNWIQNPTVHLFGRDIELNLLGTKAPYLLTPWVAVLVLIWNLLFPIIVRIFKVRSHKQSIQSGSDSSVALRDKFERSFGAGLLIIGAFALIETLPLMIHWFHQFRDSDGLRGTIAAVGGGSSLLALTGAGKLLSAVSKAKKLLATILIGLLGLLLPLIVVFYVVEDLVYGTGAEEFPLLGMLIIPGALAALLILTMILGFKSFQKWGWLFGLALVIGGVVALVIVSAQIAETKAAWIPWLLVALAAIEIWLFCFLTVDVNLTSVNGLYRDRLASAYLVGEDTKGDVDIEEDVDLHDLALHETGSIAPYQLVNVAHNLQGSDDMGVRERNSDFFIFSKRFIGGERTGYCDSRTMEKVYPQIDLASAMSISAAAASPNMGVGTSPAMVMLMTLFNIRLGYWVPNPKHLEPIVNDRNAFEFSQVFRAEIEEITARWKNLYGEEKMAERRGELTADRARPLPSNGLIGLAFSGGGIRSATINMGIAQALHRHGRDPDDQDDEQGEGVFDHVDYVSTVSGGGYLGSSISTLMRTKTKPFSEVTGRVESVETSAKGVEVKVEGKRPGSDASETRSYLYTHDAALTVEKGQSIERGEALIDTRKVVGSSLEDRFGWRVRPAAFVREMFGKLDEHHKWVNLSDGGHIENLATIELLRRRCKYIITGDGEADPNLFFGSLATLIRYARIDLGIEIDITPNLIRLLPKGVHPTDPEIDRRSEGHFAIGRITYPDGEGHGWLIYLKSSFTGDEEEVIVQYRNECRDFPHESTADQFFDEGQFEAYRALGQHIGEGVLEYAPPKFDPAKPVGSFFDEWCHRLEGVLPHRWKLDSAEPTISPAAPRQPPATLDG